MKSPSHRLDRAAGRKRLRQNRSARYPLEKSPLWGLSSTHRLAALLDVPVGELDAVCTQPAYNRFDEVKPNKAPRHIQEPTAATLRIHYRIAKHLDSVERPDFLHSATKKRSYVTNAKSHLASGGAVVAMDIQKFFENTSYQHVKNFFYKDLKCSHDIARLLATVCTADGHLPTGSCISPLLSYFTHRKLFSEIEQLCSRCNVTVTLYVDDLTMSGPHATKTILHEVKAMIKRNGLTTNAKKDAVVRPGKPTIITGAVRDDSQLRLRNKHHKAIVILQDLIASGAGNGSEKLAGQVAAARAVDPAAAVKLEARLKGILRNIP